MTFPGSPAPPARRNDPGQPTAKDDNGEPNAGHAWAGRPAPLAGALYSWRICASLSADDNRANERWNSEVAT